MSETARRYFGCFIPIVLVLAGCGVGGMLVYSSRIVMEVRRVPDAAMLPRLTPGAQALVFHVLLWADEPKRGPIVNAETPDGRVFRRIVALPGDLVEVKDGVLWIDGRPSDPAVKRTGTGPDHGPVTMGPDDYFLLADDRTMADSRVWGPLPRGKIFGEPLFANEGDGWLPIDPGVDVDWLDRAKLEAEEHAAATATAAAAP